MKKIIFLLLLQTTIFAQRNVDLFNSLKLGESRELTIEVPENYATNLNKKYPLLILLDGDYLFDPFSGMLKYSNYWQDLPETIIVGINQNKKSEREFDTEYNEDEGVPSDKGAKFFEFIGGELLPYLEKKFRIAPFKIIAGHNLTAGYLNFFLYKDKPLFNAYISLSPEFPPKMQTLLPQRLADIKEPIFYYQAVADGDNEEIRNPIKLMDESIKKIKNAKLNYKFDDFKNTSHYSMVLSSIPNALYQIFDSYKPISSADYDKILALKDGYAVYLKNKYKTISENLGIDLELRYNDFKAIEQAIIKNKAYEELDEMAQLARKNFPKTMLADYELALLYESRGDLKNASKHYLAAYTQNEVGDLTKNMMMEKVSELKKANPKK